MDTEQNFYSLLFTQFSVWLNDKIITRDTLVPFSYSSKRIISETSSKYGITVGDEKAEVLKQSGTVSRIVLINTWGFLVSGLAIHILKIQIEFVDKLLRFSALFHSVTDTAAFTSITALRMCDGANVLLTEVFVWGICFKSKGKELVHQASSLYLLTISMTP